MNTVADFKTLIKELTEILDSLSLIEEAKLKAVSTNDLEKVDSCIKEEQVQVLKVKGLDKKREQMLISLGYGNQTFREIIPLLPENEKNEAEELFENLTRATNDFNKINELAKTALEINIHAINKMVDNLKINSANEKKKAPFNGGFTNKFV